MANTIAGYVYLLHFEQPICPTHPSQHYVGWTKDLDERLYQHKKGRGAKFCGAARERGIKFVLAECWVADKSFERTIKRQKNHKRFCPICTNLVN
ncbi:MULTISPECIES: GIY-YIG nuclease family protein [unclassified Microcoleus]|uniref:GIY-YIG nuclease family protein n=1 Tax=unclassified Microcoleus TaxID=2642155 RepID=UPI002FCEC99C